LGESLVATGHSLTTAIIDGGDDAALFEAQLGAVGVTARLAAEAVNLVRAAGGNCWSSLRRSSKAALGAAVNPTRRSD
jgi:hypothetical protein